MIRPIGDRVAVKPDEAEKVTKGGILLPDTAQQKRATRGTVVAVGPGRLSEDVAGGTFLPMDVQPGDRVLFSAYSGSEVEVDGQKLLIVGQDDIHAIEDVK